MKNNPLLLKLGKSIRILRKEKGFSQENFATQADLARGFYGCIERGEKNVSILTLQKISKALNVSMSDLFVQIDSDHS